MKDCCTRWFDEHRGRDRLHTGTCPDCGENLASVGCAWVILALLAFAVLLWFAWFAGSIFVKGCCA